MVRFPLGILRHDCPGRRNHGRSDILRRLNENGVVDGSLAWVSWPEALTDQALRIRVEGVARR